MGSGSRLAYDCSRVNARLICISLALVGCGPPTPMVTPDAGQWFDAELGPCAAVGGAMPQTVDEVITRINLLPRPASVACFTASLPRPLVIGPTSSRFSAQPAGGPEDPRLFIFTDKIFLSVVPAGDGSDLLEVGEMVAPNRSLKAEFKFPVDKVVTRDDCYQHLDFAPAATSCGLCHGNEERHPAHPLARTSVSFRPPARTLVTLAKAKAFADACDRAQQPKRCLNWASVFGFGETKEGTFPTEFNDFIR